MVRDTAWIADLRHDGDEYQKLMGFVDDLASYWRTILLKQTSEALGLGLSDDEDSRAASRTALETYLRTVAATLARLDDGPPFDAVPVTTRVRKRKVESDESVAARRASTAAAKTATA
eukprot:3146138-Prymnesium_polylepis.2